VREGGEEGRCYGHHRHEQERAKDERVAEAPGGVGGPASEVADEQGVEPGVREQLEEGEVGEDEGVEAESLGTEPASKDQRRDEDERLRAGRAHEEERRVSHERAQDGHRGRT
jgi:hypothetical protein